MTTSRNLLGLVCFSTGTFFALGACTDETDLGGRDPNSKPDTGSAPASIVDACKTYLQGTNALATKCGGDPLSDEWLSYCSMKFDLPGYTFGASTLAACGERLPTLSCEDIYDREAIPECAALEAKGTLANGAPCATGNQCASGACVGGVIDVDTMKCGTCGEAVGVGSSCENEPCEQGSLCVGGNVGEATCVPELAEGASCEGDVGYCRLPLVCDSSTKRCRKGQGTGSPCSASEPCAIALNCIDGSCKLPGRLGDVCERDDSCGSSFVCDGATKRCVDGRNIANGDDCDPFGQARCVEGATCQDGICVSVLAPGAPCSPNGTPCREYHYCGANGTCEPINPASCQ